MNRFSALALSLATLAVTLTRDVEWGSADRQSYRPASPYFAILGRSLSEVLPPLLRSHVNCSCAS